MINLLIFAIFGVGLFFTVMIGGIFLVTLFTYTPTKAEQRRFRADIEYL